MSINIRAPNEGWTSADEIGLLYLTQQNTALQKKKKLEKFKSSERSLYCFCCSNDKHVQLKEK